MARAWCVLSTSESIYCVRLQVKLWCDVTKCEMKVKRGVHLGSPHVLFVFRHPRCVLRCGATPLCSWHILAHCHWAAPTPGWYQVNRERLLPEQRLRFSPICRWPPEALIEAKSVEKLGAASSRYRLVAGCAARYVHRQCLKPNHGLLPWPWAAAPACLPGRVARW